eukprot:m.1458496 g.1458496  ORF g.1458496 m.1458496 type:complete len:670 (-) comp25122_c0_seq1:4287-6296(-)
MGLTEQSAEPIGTSAKDNNCGEVWRATKAVEARRALVGTVKYFAVCVLCFAIPLGYWTTIVHRAPLPTSAIQNLNKSAPVQRLDIQVHALLEKTTDVSITGAKRVRITPLTWNQAQQRIVIYGNVSRHGATNANERVIHTCNYNYGVDNAEAAASCVELLKHRCSEDHGMDMCIVALPLHDENGGAIHASDELKKPQALLSTVHRLVLRNAWDPSTEALSPLAVRLVHEVAYGGGGNRKGRYVDALEVPVVGRGLVDDIDVHDDASEIVKTPIQSSLGNVSTSPVSTCTVRRCYHIAFNLINSNPIRHTVTWNIAQAIDEVLEPFLESFTDIFTVTTSTQQTFQVNPELFPMQQARNASAVGSNGNNSCHTDQHHTSVVMEEDFPAYTSVMGVPHTSVAQPHPHVTFIVHVPRHSDMPLHLHNNRNVRVRDNAFLVPRWGGVKVISGDDATESHATCTAQSAPTTDNATTKVDIDVDMPQILKDVFVPQLRKLIGIPALKVATMQPLRENSGATVGTPVIASLHEWEVQRAQRRMILQDVDCAINAVQGLSALVGSIQNMVINDDVADAVTMATAAVERIHHDARLGASHVQPVYDAARQACVRAEHAFYNPTLLALLYFPTDEMYAVFVPYGVPLLMLAVSTLVKQRKQLARNEAALAAAHATHKKSA